MPLMINEVVSPRLVSLSIQTARIVPADRHEGVISRSRAELLSRLERQPVVDAGPWTRDELYEDGSR